MDQIWRSLPNDIVYKIVSHLDIDTRRAFRIPPRRILDFPNFELKLETVYDASKKLLREVDVDEDGNFFTFFRKGITLDVLPNEIYVFNMGWKPYQLIMYTNEYMFGPAECSNHIVKNKKVKMI